jgi:hypothetical protein
MGVHYSYIWSLRVVVLSVASLFNIGALWILIFVVCYPWSQWNRTLMIILVRLAIIIMLGLNCEVNDGEIAMSYYY